MAHTFSALFAHVIFSTKHRQASLAPEMRTRLFPYMAGIVGNLDGHPVLINGVEDHVHILAVVPATIAISDLVREIKCNSSAWLKGVFPVPDFAWQIGYAAFSVSKSSVESVRQYIADQEEHHRRLSFQEEYIAFLKRHEIAYDERFVFD